MRAYLLGGLVVVAVGLGALAAYRGQPSTAGAKAGPAEVQATPTNERPGVVKWLKPCEQPCLNADGQPAKRFEVVPLSGDCHPHCFELREVADGADCTYPCFIVVDQPDGTCEYELTLPAGPSGEHCPPDCTGGQIKPCYPDC